MDPGVTAEAGRRGPVFRRRHLIELHEQPWFPAVWRDLFRAGLGKAFVLFGLSREFSRALSRLLAVHRPSEVLDLCSGSGECSADAWRHARAPDEASACVLVLSDLYPDRQRWTRADPAARYIDAPLDARTLAADLPRTRMMLSALHHFRPDDLRELLRATASEADAFVAVDRSARNWREMLVTLFVVPFAAAFITAFMIRPFRPRNLLWGLIIPVIPLVALLDGIVSNLRSYTVEELQTLTRDVATTFTWEVGQTPGDRQVPPMTYIIGVRRAADGPSL